MKQSAQKVGYFIPAAEVEKLVDSKSELFKEYMQLYGDTKAFYETVDRCMIYAPPELRKTLRTQRRTLMFTLLELKGKYEADSKTADSEP